MQRQLRSQFANHSAACCVTAAATIVSTRGLTMYSRDAAHAGHVETVPRTDEDYKLDPSRPVPGSHPLPLTNTEARNLRWPLVSPYMPSPQRPHPYFTEPLPEFPHFAPSVPLVYPKYCLKDPIVVPVMNTDSATISHTRQLDPFVFGHYPLNDTLYKNYSYWIVRNQNYKRMWDLARVEVHRKAKKAYMHTGTGMSRQSEMKTHNFPWGGRQSASKPWRMMMPTAQPDMWHTANRMALCLKVLQGKLQIVDRLTLPEPTTAAFGDLCRRMGWDTRHKGAGVLFMDGGSRLTPSREFDTNFFYGSFVNGRVKVVRPTVAVEEPIDWNRDMHDLKWLGPKGPKNPVPFNRFNVFDAMEHHLVVVTEGAVVQLEREMMTHKLRQMPPHIVNQLAAAGQLDHFLLGTVAAPLPPVQDEAAGRTEEVERSMYAAFYDNPYEPWADEPRASYSVDGIDGVVRRHVTDAAPVPDGEAASSTGSATTSERAGSWRVLE